MSSCFSTAKLRLCRSILFLTLILSSLFPTLKAVALAENLEGEVDTAADSLQYIKEEQKLVAKGNVAFTYKDIELTADEAEIHSDTKKGHAKGHVVLRQKGKATLSGDEVFFDFKNNQGSFPDGRFFQFPWYGHGEKLEQVNKNKLHAVNVFITSCDLPTPHYDVKAESADIYPGDKIIAKNVTFRILETPVFWLPYLVIPLKDSPLDITPGYSNEWGAFLLVAKGFSINENVNGKLRADYYSKRGFGAGSDVNYKFDQLGIGQLKIYGIRDQDAPDDREANPFMDENRSDTYRGRVSWKHKARIDPLTTLQLQWHEISDARFLQDFFEREHFEESAPQSFITITRNADQYSLLTHVEKRTNRFETVSEKLPEVVFTWLRKPLFGTNYYYTHEDGLINFNQTKTYDADGPNTVQIYTDQELSYPTRFFQFYHLNPFVNVRDDYFTRGREKEHGLTRFVFGTGFDMRTQFYRTMNYEGNPFGIEINQLRHVMEPLIQYSAIKYTNLDPSRLVVTGRGDQLDLQDIVTFGVENRIQTKRRDKAGNLQRVDLVSFNAFLDYSFGPGSDLLRTRANKFTDARFETILRPYDWLAIRMETDFDFIDQDIYTHNADLVFDPGRFQITISHRYRNDRTHDGRFVSNLEVLRPHLVLDDASTDHQLTVDVVYDLNTRWDLGAYARWQVNDNVLEEWELRAQRDLHDWLLDFGFNVRNSERTDAKTELNKEAFVQLRLKALPDIELKTGHRANFADSRIGRTVSGSNEAPTPPAMTLTPDAQYASLSTP